MLGVLVMLVVLVVSSRELVVFFGGHLRLLAVAGRAVGGRVDVVGLLHLLAFVGFVLSGVFGIWLIWGIFRRGRL